ncbi:hypothetical protein [Synechococcus sp. CS-205]|uniref:hypothetical protein n=1 Tax=Synechococcus sp. CS-205 TaxID=2847984 RepID=UPI00223AB12A|nr:hypothetical protein [Synechococcus sp. CS-205]MCT0249766.1 hypothetical protein [Synechococcus sp. CS-205]
MNLREYAQHRKDRGLAGTTHVAVYYAATKGRLPTSAKKVGGGWEIDAEIADQEWELNKRNPVMRVSAAGGMTMVEGPKLAADLPGGIPNLVRAESEKRRAEADLKIMQVKLRQGQLIEASKIRPLIFQRHRQFRDAVQNIPVRVVDSIAAIIGDLDTDQRHKIRTLVSTECRRVLEDLAKNPILEPPAVDSAPAAAG